MKKTNILSLVLIFISISYSSAEKIMLSSCENNKDGFLKNEYILDLEQSLMTRNYVYKEKTYQKYRLTDLSIKKSNSYVSNIYEENGKIFTHKHGYPQFYTQILFEKGKSEIFIKTVLNDEEGISKISTCKKKEKFDRQS